MCLANHFFFAAKFLKFLMLKLKYFLSLISDTIMKEHKVLCYQFKMKKKFAIIAVFLLSSGM